MENSSHSSFSSTFPELKKPCLIFFPRSLQSQKKPQTQNQAKKYRKSSLYADSVYAHSLYTSSKNFMQSEELLIKSALSEFWSNFSITDSLYTIFTLRELPRTQNSRKERTPCNVFAEIVTSVELSITQKLLKFQQ